MTWASIPCALNQRASQTPSRPASKATVIRSILCPAFSASFRHRSKSFKSSFSSGSSFFKGWRSTPGMMPATSQLSLLSSIAAINVWLGSNGVSERLRSLSGLCCCFGLRIDGLHRQGCYRPSPNITLVFAIGVPVARLFDTPQLTCRAAAQPYLAPPPQEILEQVDAAPGIAVADIVAGRVNLAQFGAGNAIAHLLIGAGMTDLLAAGGHDQRRRAHLMKVLHEVVGAHVRDEAPNEGRIVRAGLLYEPSDMLGIGALIEALGNRVGQKAL